MTLESILSKVLRPGRYIGGEWNIVKKDWREDKVKVALAFPDLYEVGMSHLGLKIIYSILNDREDCLAERVYAPAIDMEKILKDKNIPIFSLETRKKLTDFDIIGFTLPYELCYTNIFTILGLSGIPFLSEERKQGTYPLLIAGGSGVFNPEPLSSFFDAFVIGEGEEVCQELVDVFASWKKKGEGREILLERLAEIPGIYVPSFYDIAYHPDGRIKGIKPKKGNIPEIVEKRYVKDFENAFFPVKFVVPYVETIHDRLTVEISRGCTHGCRFCQAGTIYRPFRFRSKERILELASEGIKNTGYTEISLSSLCPGDYPDLEKLVDILISKFSKRKTAVSLPSLRIDNFPIEAARKIQEIRKTGFTFAVEAGSQRLRDIVNKQVTEENLLSIVEKVTQLGWKLVKLYFIIGLPGEKKEDLDEIRFLLNKVGEVLRKKGRGKFNVSISFFVPKPNTPFQWEAQPAIDVLREKRDYLKSTVKWPLKFHWLEHSFLEAVIARGDRRLGKVIVSAWEKGARFDSWNEHFRYDLWTESFKENNIDPSFYANRAREYDEIFPWEHIRTGINKEYLLEEHKRARENKITYDCRDGGCNSCGLDSECQKKKRVMGQGSSIKEETTTLNPKPLSLVAQAVRMRFTKEGDIRFISHLDFTKALLMAMERAGVNFTYSQGFSPRPKISFAPALSLGWESETEFVETEIAGESDWIGLAKRINDNLPQGIRLMEIKPLSKIGLIGKEIKGAIYIICFVREFDAVSLAEKLKALFPAVEIEVNKTDSIKLKLDLQPDSVKLKDILNKIYELFPDLEISVRRISFYNKNGKGI